MSDISIRVDALGKRYRIGGRQASYRTLRETLSGTATAPFRRLASIARRSRSDTIWALKDVSFEVKRGEVVGVIGRNGAGKSTLLKLLSRITDPTDGWIELDGHVGPLLEVGTGFHPELTGRENIFLSGAILGMKRAEIARKFDAIVEFAGVDKFIDTPVKHYSSGMYVRLGFAVASHLEPDILVVDEVLAVGDTHFQRKCLGKMGEVAHAGRTVLFVSHNLAAIGSLCHRGLLLESGHLVVDGPVDQAIGAYSAARPAEPSDANGARSLAKHRGRVKPAEGLVCLASCRLLDADEQPVSCFKSGDQARLEIQYRTTGPVASAYVEFLVTVADVMQQRVFGCSNQYVGLELPVLPDGGHVQCVIPRLPLVPGHYVIHLGCRVNGGWSDGVYEASEFDVVDGDFFGSGRLPPAKDGRVLVPHHWIAAS